MASQIRSGAEQPSAPQTENRKTGALYDYSIQQANSSAITLTAGTNTTVDFQFSGQWFNLAKSVLQFQLVINPNVTSTGWFQIMTYGWPALLDQVILTYNGREIANVQYHDIYSHMLQEYRSGKIDGGTRYYYERRYPPELVVTTTDTAYTLNSYDTGQIITKANSGADIDTFPIDSFVQYTSMGNPGSTVNAGAIPSQTLNFQISLKDLLPMTICEVEDFSIYYRQGLRLKLIFKDWTTQTALIKLTATNDKVFLGDTTFTAYGAAATCSLNNLQLQLAVPRQLDQRILRPFSYKFSYIFQQSSTGLANSYTQKNAAWLNGLRQVATFISFYWTRVNNNAQNTFFLGYNNYLLQADTASATNSALPILTSLKIQVDSQPSLQQCQSTDFQLTSYIDQQNLRNRLKPKYNLISAMKQCGVIPIKYYEDDGSEGRECDVEQGLQVDGVQNGFNAADTNTLYIIQVYDRFATYDMYGDLIFSQ